MEPEITEVIADLVHEAEPDLESRLESQAEALLERKCVTPLIGSLVDAFDVKYLLSSLSLEDPDFAATFSALSSMTSERRVELVKSIKVHFNQCPHCFLKRSYDLEIDARIKQVCRNNAPFLLRLLSEEEPEPSKESDHRTIGIAPHPAMAPAPCYEFGVMSSPMISECESSAATMDSECFLIAAEESI